MLAQAKTAADSLKAKVPEAVKAAEAKEAEEKEEDVAKLEAEIAPHTSTKDKKSLEEQVKDEKAKTAALRGQQAKLNAALNATDAKVAGLTASIAELHKEADSEASALKAVKDPLREAVAVELSHVDAEVLRSPTEEVAAAPKAKAPVADVVPSSAAPLCAVLAFAALA